MKVGGIRFFILIYKFRGYLGGIVKTTNSFIGYSEAYKNALTSKLGDTLEVNTLQPFFPIMMGAQQIISQGQIPQNAPWLIKRQDIRIEFQPNKIDIISEKFINTEKDEIDRMGELTELIKRINEAISIGCITRMAYAPSWGIESDDHTSVNTLWNTIVKIPDLPNSHKQERMIRYNTLCKQNFGSHQDIEINRVVTITEGQRVETRNNPAEGQITNKPIECMIVSIDINTTNKVQGIYSTDDVNVFCQKAQNMGRQLLAVINTHKN